MARRSHTAAANSASWASLGALGLAARAPDASWARLGAVAARASVAPELALHRRGMTAHQPGRLRRADPRLGQRLNPSALLKTKTPCHTKNLHRSVVANSPAIIANQLQPPVEVAVP